MGEEQITHLNCERMFCDNSPSVSTVLFLPLESVGGEKLSGHMTSIVVCNNDGTVEAAKGFT